VKALANYALFQGVWLVAVWGASAGRLYDGLAAALVMLAVHAAMVPAGARRHELVYVAAATLAGTAVDSALSGLGLIFYPGSRGWTAPTAPPWIVGLWLAFAMLPRFSLAWLRARPLLAAVLGAVGGPLSFLAGARLGAVAAGAPVTWVALAVEYAVATPLLLGLAPGDARQVALDAAAENAAERR